MLRVITAAMKTKPLLLVALDAVICAPSGDQLITVSAQFRTRVALQNYYLSLRKNVLPGESSNGLETSASNDQSVVLQILTVLSSEHVARNSPTGSQQTPFTKPWC